MKILITESQYKKILKEQKYNIPQSTSDYLGSGGRMEKNLYQGDKENYAELFKKKN